MVTPPKRALIALALLALVWPAHALSAVATSRVDPTLLKAVVRILVKGKRSYVGTGFIVSRAPEDRPNERNYYLVTNKHVIGDWNVFDTDFREYVDALELTFFRDGAPSAPVTVKLTDARGALDVTAVLPHPNPIVDIAAIAIPPDVLRAAASTPVVAFDFSYLLRSERITSLLAGLGDQVFAIGYPKGISSQTAPYPIAKVGYLATQPGPSLTFDVTVDNRTRRQVSRKLTGTLVLVDGLVLPGNSGGPLVLVNDLKLRRNPATNDVEVANAQMKNFVVGVVSMSLSETSGLTLVYAADYVAEVVETFDQFRRGSLK